MLFWLFLIFLVIICLLSYKFYFGGNHNSNALVNDIMVELSQYDNTRVEKYLALNDVKDIVKTKKIKSVNDFFEKENINRNAFYTATQKEIMAQSGQLLNKNALHKSDLELYDAYINKEDIFL